MEKLTCLLMFKISTKNKTNFIVNNNSKYLYIPIEIFTRELKGAMLLSLVAVKYGWNVVVGGKQSIFPVLDKLPEGVVLLKSVVPGEIKLQKKIISYGHKIVSLDAEGLLPSNGKSGVELRYSKDTIALSNILFFWGNAQLKLVEQVFPNIKENACVTGSPVFDYWKYLKNSHNRQGDQAQKVILIATSFPYANHIINNETARLSVKNASGSDATDGHLDEIFLDAKVQEIVYPKFIKLVKGIIRRNPTSKILIRPHPSENSDTWEKITNKFSNVELQVGGEISKQIFLCDIFLHFNSTTSIEACYLGKKVITYLPKMNLNLQSRLNQYALDASYVCNSFDEVFQAIDNCSERVKPPPESLRDIIYGFDSKQVVNSSSMIVKALNKLDINSSRLRFPSKFELIFSLNLIGYNFKFFIVWILGWIDYFTNIFSGKYEPMRNYYKYGKTKQGELDMISIQSELSTMSLQLEMDLNSYSFKKISKKSFLVSPVNIQED